jgi:pimeloyl-ACP methyl ester carboxylesterase
MTHITRPSHGARRTRSLVAGVAAATLALVLGCALPAQATPDTSDSPEPGPPAASPSSTPSPTAEPSPEATRTEEADTPSSGTSAPSPDASADADRTTGAPSAEPTRTAEPTEPTESGQDAPDASSSDAAEPSSEQGKKIQEKAEELARDREDGLDEYYPELAEQRFDADGDGTYEIGAPAPGGKATGTVPSGLGSYYAQKVDWSSKNCEALGFGADWVKKYQNRLGRDILCGYVIAPIDAKNPASGNLAVAAMKVPAAGRSKGSVFWNPGGPGGSGLTLGLSGAIYEPDLAEHYDMVGFDPRGTGSSMPYSQCSSDEQLDQDRSSTALSRPRDEAEKLLNDDAERYAADCFENTGKAFGLDEGGRKTLVSHLGTWDAVGDLDLLRSVVGDPKLQYVGFSYGTRLGYVYAQKFQASAGRLVLDGVVDPGDAQSIKALKQLNDSSERYFDPTDTGRKAKDDGISADDADNIAQGAGFQDTFEQFALDCSAQADGTRTWGDVYPDLYQEGSLLEGDPLGNQDDAFHCPLGDGITDPEILTDKNAELLQTLLDVDSGAGLPTGLDGDERKVTFSDARTGEIQALYSNTLWGQLAAGLAELKEGDSAGVLMLLADQYNARDAQTGHYDPMLQAFTTIRCTDQNASEALKDPEVAKEYQEYLRRVGKAYDEAAPFQASGLEIGTHDYCDFWQFAGTLPQAQKLTKIPNVLVVSTSHDPATPYAAGPKLARLIDGTLLSVSGTSHTSYMANSQCTDETVNDFLVNGVVPADGEFGRKLSAPDHAKDDQGKTVEFTKECQVETFRDSDFVTSTDRAYALDSVGFAATHVDSEAKYSVTLTSVKGGKGAAVPAAAKAVADGVRTDNGGNVTGQFRVPDGTAPGRYQVGLVSSDGVVVASRPLTVQERAAKPDPTSQAPSPGDGGAAQGGDGSDHGDDGAGAPTGDTGGGQAAQHGNLSSTGAEVTGWVLGGALAVLAGAALVATSILRRKGKH